MIRLVPVHTFKTPEGERVSGKRGFIWIKLQVWFQGIRLVLAEPKLYNVVNIFHVSKWFKYGELFKHCIENVNLKG